MVNCKICNEEFESETNLHRHLRKHKMTIETYYVTQFPRRDKYSNELISFKSKEYYFSNDFVCKENFAKWIKSAPSSVAEEYIKEYLIKRKSSKSLQFIPSQVELRSLNGPSIVTFEKYFDYFEFCAGLGMSAKFQNINYVFSCGDEDHTILVDTREQKPFELPVYKIQKLDYGDYCLEESDVKPKCYIERKSANDFIGTLSELERFEKEVVRANENGDYLVVLVEERLSNLLSFNKKLANCERFCVSPEHIFHNVRYLMQKYNNIQFLFANGREEALRLCSKILRERSAHFSTDLQLLYDKKIL